MTETQNDKHRFSISQFCPVCGYGHVSSKGGQLYKCSLCGCIYSLEGDELVLEGGPY